MVDDEEECVCDCGVNFGYFWHHGVQRKSMYCKNCGKMLDYYPQYSEDNL